jgi:COP9 signalosome complex subunit 2
LSFIASQLNNVSVETVESLLVPLLLDGKLKGKIDSVDGVLDLEREGEGDRLDRERRDALRKLTASLKEGEARARASGHGRGEGVR